MKRRGTLLMTATAALVVGACGGAPGGADSAAEEPDEQTPLIQLWSDGVPAFGVFVPSERERGALGPDGERLPPLYTSEGGAVLAANPLLDYVFLNLEGSYDAGAIGQIKAGLASPLAVSEKALLVRIPPISADGPEAALARVTEAFAAGADGVVMPHIKSVDEALMAVGFAETLGIDIWSPTNPDGTKLLMLMVEDAGALAQVQEIADAGGYSVLACGIGSLTQALGDRDAAEAGNIEVLRHAQRVGLPDMITANASNVGQRIEEGFLGLLMSGPQADADIEVGRAAAGR